MVPALLGVLAAAATAFALQPLFASADVSTAAPRTEAERERLRLAEKRDQLLMGLAELDFERDAGKLAGAEHEETRTRLLAEAARVTARLDELDR